MNLMIRIAQSLGRSHALRQGSSAVRKMGESSKQQRGFTLLEMMFVISIMGITMAIAVPEFSKWRDRQAVNSASKSLMSHMKQARVIAMAENRSVKITFTADDYTYDADPTGTCGLCNPQTIKFSNFSQNLRITPTTTRTFSSRGTVNNGTITLEAGQPGQLFTHELTLNIIGRVYWQ